MGFDFERELRASINTLNVLIRDINATGGSVHLCLKENPDFSVKLTGPVDVTYWVPVSRPEEVSIHEQIDKARR